MATVAVVVLAAAGFVLLLLAPPRLRMPTVLGATPPVLVAGQLGLVPKEVGFPLMLLLSVAAVRHPGWRWPPKVVFLYPAVALAAVPIVSYAVDAHTAMLLRVQWVALTVAVVCVAGTVVDRSSLWVVLRAVAIGMVVAVALPLTDAPQATTYGYGRRFAPYGISPNHIAISLAVAAVWLTAAAYQAQSRRVGLAYGVAAATAVAMILLTASRSSALVILVGLGLLTLHAVRRRLLLIFPVVALVVLAGVLVVNYFPDHRLDRLSGEDVFKHKERSRFWVEYRQAIAQRPLAGLAFTHGERANSLEGLDGASTHSAYVEWLYLVGWPLSLVMFGLGAGSLVALWRLRGRLPVVVLLLFTGVLVGGYIHGAFNRHLYYPTHMLAFAHLLAAVLAYTASTRLKPLVTPARSPAPSRAPHHRAPGSVPAQQA